MTYPFTEEQLNKAAEDWGCNCGPSALAFALQLPLDSARNAIPEFEKKGYTSPTMMKAALESLRRTVHPIRPPQFTSGKPIDVERMFDERPALVRVQWTGPWTKPGVNPKWSYWHTHWIATWREQYAPLVFDCNGGAMGVTRWIDEIVPLLTKDTPRADGEWFPTHIWQIQ